MLEIKRFSIAFGLLVLAITGVGYVPVFAQAGKLAGKVVDSETKEGVSFANIRVLSGGAQKGVAVADINGEYKISPLTPGTYTVEAMSTGYAKGVINKVTIKFEQTERLDIVLTPLTKTTEEVVVVEFKKKLIAPDEGMKNSLSAEEIAKIPTRNVNQMIATQANVYSQDDGAGINIRGNRTTDNAVFVNGVRQFATTLPPAEAISELSVVAGGIPAQYGDALGGIISITTKGAAQKLSYGVQGETSSLFDQWHYNFAGINGSGPILKTKASENADGTKNESRTLLGFFGAAQFTYNRDANPSAIGVYKAKESALQKLRDQPLTRFGNSYTNSSNYFSLDDVEKIKYRPNNWDRTLQTNLNLDFQPTENVIVTLGGNLNLSRQRTSPGENSYINPFNYMNNSNRDQIDYNVFLRFRQSFNNGIADSGAFLRNAYYQIQVDRTERTITVYDPRFYDRLNEYNYVGKFTPNLIKFQLPTAATGYPGRTIYPSSFIGDSLVVGQRTLWSTNKQVVEVQDELSGYNYVPGGLNPALEAYDNQIYKEVGLVDPVLLSTLGGLQNGQSVGSINDVAYFFPAYGKSLNSFSKQNDNQTRVSAQFAAEIKDHTIKIGGEYEQRVISNYNTIGSLYSRARQKVNGHLLEGSSGEVVRYDTSDITDPNDPNFGKELVRVYRTPLVNPLKDGNGNPLGQTDFDRNFRKKHNLALDQKIYIDAYDPSSFGISDFSISEILDNGNSPLALWQGYTPFGKRISKTSFYDFFTDTINRPVDAFRPIYYAGFIEDKFEIKDLIIRLGLRVDAFDANMPVLADKYSFTKLKTAGELDFTKFSGGRARPANVQDGWAVYVNQPANSYNGSNQGDFEVVGYRSENTWYDANGTEIGNPSVLERNGQVHPFFDVTGKSNTEQSLQRSTGITLDAYRDFKPQVNVLPRLSFSFPISENALFYAHYDILTQRPLGVDNNGTLQQNYASPVDYFSLLTNNGGYINNPNLKPQKKIDYALGFQQKINDRSAIKLSCFYSEIKDLIQVINVNYAYPIRYQTSGNQDFSVVKGASIQYDLRRSDNFTATASYTLSFAEGSASSFAGNLLNTSTPNLRNTIPLNYDQRHAIKLNFDYRLNSKQGPEIFGMFPFENMGINTTLYAGSGTPYTQDGSPWGGRTTVKGSVNGARLPWNNRTSVRVDKSFIVKKEGSKNEHNINVYMYVQNLFNAQNTLGVYTRTGSPTDDGYLVSDYGKQQTRQQVGPESYAMFYNLSILDPNNLSLPRRFRLGVSYSF